MKAIESPVKLVEFVDTVSYPDEELLEVTNDIEELYIEMSKFAPLGLVRPSEKPLLRGTSMAKKSPWSAGFCPAFNSPRYVALLSDRFTLGRALPEKSGASP
jgi:hypothetical protein